MADSAATVNAMYSFLGLYLAGIGSALCIAVITSGMVYLVRPIVGYLVQSMTLGQWASRRLFDDRITVPEWLVKAATSHEMNGENAAKSVLGTYKRTVEQAEGRARYRPFFRIFGFGLLLDHRLIGLKTGPSQLRDELFMHAVEAEAKCAIARPSSNPLLFMAVTSGAPSDARGITALFDFIAREHPDIAAKMSTFEDTERSDYAGALETHRLRSTSASIQAAQAVLLATAESALDKLQLSLLAGAIWPYRILSVGIGICIGMFGMSALELRNSVLFLSVGASGGVLSLFISDALAFLTRRIAR
ncbi:hypothetical protein [Mesorhizobium sp. B2-8-9]|uniref:hypothetical protein n=1 Tax=Mesorhizobium sp. B2-8-9 TaxID=2589899 RepID=UPI0015E2CD11|nr:hypothetical protein [Mesorhizobium sp. B2-8-9]